MLSHSFCIDLKGGLVMPVDNRKNKAGGRREGAGRPKGSKNINSMASVRKLEELGFDPIEEMTKLYAEINVKLLMALLGLALVPMPSCYQHKAN